MNKLTLVFLICFSYYVFSQNFSWAKKIGGDSSVSLGISVVSDSLGNVYTVGMYQGTIDCDPGPNTFNITSISNWDFFVAKMNSSGDFLWAKSFGDIGNERVTSVDIDRRGNLYIVGDFDSKFELNTSAGKIDLISNGELDVFILSLDSLGNLRWVKSIGSYKDDATSVVTCGKDDNIYISGIYGDSVDFNENIEHHDFLYNSSNSWNMFTLKLNSSGSFIWVKSFESGNTSVITSQTINSNGDFFATGRVVDSVDFDDSENKQIVKSGITQDIFILKLDKNGDLVFVKTLHEDDSQSSLAINQGNSIKIDNNSNIFVCGNFFGILNYDTMKSVLISKGIEDAFVSKFDSSGNFLWAKNITSKGNFVAKVMCLDHLNNVFVAGNYTDSLFLDNYQVVSQGSDDIFVSKITNSGNVSKLQSFGGDGVDYIYQISHNSLNELYLTGFFNGNADFDPSENFHYLKSSPNAGGTTFLLKLLNDIVTYNSNNDLLKMEDLYPNPTSDYIHINNYLNQTSTNYSIYNSNGSKVSMGVLYSNESKIDIGFLSSGLYFFQIGDNKYKFKFLKE